MVSPFGHFFNTFFMNYIPKMSELHEQFCAEASIMRNLTPATIKWYQDGFYMFFKYKKNESIYEFNETNLMNFFFWGRQERKWSARTALTYYQSLSSFSTWLIKKGLIKESPLKDIPRPKLEKKLPKALTRKDTEKLFEMVQIAPRETKYRFEKFDRKRDVAIIAMFLFTGLRRQELLDLKLIHVNLDEDMITVRGGKGMKDRVLPISWELKKHLILYLKERNKSSNPSFHFFITFQGGTGQMGVRTLTRMFKWLRDTSGVYFSPHILRHTFATLMLQGQCDLFSLSKMLGHSDIKTTTIYLSATAEHLKTQMNHHPLNFL